MDAGENAALPAKMKCDICHSTAYTMLPQDPRIAVCADCGFVFVPQRRSPQEIAKAWDNVWGEGYTSAWPMVKARLTYVCEWLDCNINLAGKNVMDIGAGEGEFLKMVRLKDAEPYAVEPCRNNIDLIRKAHIPHFHGPIEDCPAVGKFDIITVLWTLENCGDCIDFLATAKKFLKPDGRIVVATGSRILVPFKKPLSDYLNPDSEADLHSFRFSRNALYNALAVSGFIPRMINRHMDSDWLLMAATPGQTPMIEGDDPEAVLSFFDTWSKTWP